jgi:phosphate transport system permease protein
MATETPTIGTGAARPLSRKRIRPFDAAFHGALLLAIAIALGALAWLLASVLIVGLPLLDWSFVTSKPTSDPATSGFLSPIIGSFVLMFWVAAVSIPLGFATAIYLEKFAPTSRESLASWASIRERRFRESSHTGLRHATGRVRLALVRLWARVGARVNSILDINISNLAAVPSIIYGILGLAVFVTFFGLNKSLLAGGLTLALLVLPIVIIAAREAIKAVPISIEQGAMALGATKWQAVSRQILPAALPGMLTGTILAMSRAIGEAAPLIVVGGVVFSTSVPSADPLAANDQALWAMPLQIFTWAFDFKKDFQDLAAPGIIVLLVVLLAMNAAAIIIRNKFSRRW